MIITAFSLESGKRLVVGFLHTMCGGYKDSNRSLLSIVTMRLFSRYPNGSSKNQRLHRIIRCKCIEHFRTEDGVL